MRWDKDSDHGGFLQTPFCAHPHDNTLGPRSLCGLDFSLLSSSMQGFVLQNSLENAEMLKTEMRRVEWASALENCGCPGLAGVEVTGAAGGGP